jgi:hypothetical protein
MDGTRVYRHDGWSSTTTAGSSGWTDYTFAADIKPSAWTSEQDGVTVRVTDPGNFYSLRFSGGTSLVLGKNVNGTWTQLASVPFSYSATWYHLVIVVTGSSLSVSVNNQALMLVADSSQPTGAIGFETNAPFSADNVLITNSTALAVAIPSSAMTISSARHILVS